MRRVGFALAVALGAAACSPSGTGVLLTIDGSGVTADQLSITAHYGANAIRHLVPGTARALTFPTTIVIALPDAATTVSLDVTALAGGSAVASASTAMLTVGAHKLVPATVDLGTTVVTPDGGGPGGCGKIGVLVDPFTAGAHDTLFSPYATGGETISPTGLTLTITMPANAANASEAGYPSQAYYDATSSSVTIEAPKMVDTSTTAYAGLSLNRGDGDYLEIAQESGSLHIDSVASKARTRINSVTYDPVMQRWWRLREAGGKVFFETAPDGTTWKSQGMTATPSWAPYAFVNIFAGADGDVQNGGTAQFTQLNHGQATGVRCAASSLSDDFQAATRGDQWLAADSSRCTMNQGGGQLDFALQPTPSDCQYTSSYSYDLTGSAVFVRVPTAPAKSDGAVSWLRVVTDNSTAAGYELDVDEGSLYCLRRNPDGSVAGNTSTQFDPNSDSWWRIREAGGTIYYELSSDGKTWDQFATEPVTLPVTAIRVQLGVSVYDKAATAPTHVDFANLNVAPQ